MVAQSRSISTRVAKILQAVRRPSDHRARFGNIAHLLTGNFIGSLLGLAAFALSARALGPDAFGRLALIYTFVRVVERVVSFQSWQPIIRYGADLQGPESRSDLRMLLKFGLLLDMGAAGCAFAVAVACVLALSPVFGWSAETTRILLLYSCVLLFQLSGMPTAVQRLAGKFRLIAYSQLVNSVVRVALCAIGLAGSAGLGYFAAVWAGTQVLGSLILLGLAFRTLHRQGVRGLVTASVRGVTRRFPGIWGFAWSANLSLTLRMSAQEVDTLLVGALADPAAAGLYHIAKRIGRAGQQVGAQVQAVLYPDVARLWAKGRIAEFRRVVVQVEGFLLCAGIAGIILVALTIEPVLRWTAGREFVAAAPLVVVQMVAVALMLSGSAARVALLAMGRERQVLSVVVVGIVVFYASAIALIPVLGPLGANLAHIGLGIVWVAGLGFFLHRALSLHPTSAEPAARGAERVGQPDLLAPEGA